MKDTVGGNDRKENFNMTKSGTVSFVKTCTVMRCGLRIFYKIQGGALRRLSIHLSLIWVHIHVHTGIWVKVFNAQQICLQTQFSKLLRQSMTANHCYIFDQCMSDHLNVLELTLPENNIQSSTSVVPKLLQAAAPLTSSWVPTVLIHSDSEF